ncbi:MAG: hypothetical protein M1168_00355 [Candidatus Marsarchaeota archaeon]|nr:hypothetical protein [Candidatus Marsarchaeota archaeon]MCL5094423.1 hypothetical protein [Candidatus Marsarchaeota archaeon]
MKNKNLKSKNNKKMNKYGNASKKQTRCIICGEEKQGIEVENDWIIDSIRWFKRNITKNEKNYKLIVCQNCYPKYQKQYNSFKNKRIFYLVLGVIFTALLFIASSFNIFSLLSGFILILFLYLLSLLSYMPKLKTKENVATS